MKANRLVLGVAAATASILAVSGCSATGDVAIKVGETTFVTSDVDLLTDFQCGYLETLVSDPQYAGQVSAVPRKQARSDMASVLVASALDGRLAEEAGVTVDPSRLAQPMAQLGPTIERIATGEDRTRLRELVTDSIANGFAVSDIAVQLAQQSGIDASQQQVAQAAFALRAGEAARAGVDIDPVFGLDENGLGPGDDPSLSVGLSEFAQKATANPPDPTLVDGLPANQRCGG